MNNIGFRVLSRKNKVEARVVEGFRDAVTPHVSDNLNRMFSAGTSLRPYHKGGKLLGTALTVKTRPGDNLMVHKAIDIAEPGDVIVVDAGGDTTNAIVGEIMLELAKKRGVEGFVIDGAIRDTEAFMSGDFPIYAKGVTHRGPYKDGPGEVNVEITLGEMIVKPGDLLLGDEDGLVVIPIEAAEDILEKVQAQSKKEVEIFESIRNGTIDRSWIDETLKKKGCEFYETSHKV